MDREQQGRVKRQKKKKLSSIFPELIDRSIRAWYKSHKFTFLQNVGFIFFKNVNSLLGPLGISYCKNRAIPKRRTVINPSHTCTRTLVAKTSARLGNAAGRNGQPLPRWNNRGARNDCAPAPATLSRKPGTFRFEAANSANRFSVRRRQPASQSMRLALQRPRKLAASNIAHCSRALLRAAQGRLNRLSSRALTTSIPGRADILKRRKSENALCTVLIVAQRLAPTNSTRHKNIRLNRSRKALPGLKTGN